MDSPILPTGNSHSLAEDFRTALVANSSAMAAWNSITPLARNEWICWIETAKLAETRNRRIERASNELAEGKRRPCCWPGCIHRDNKTKDN